MDEKQKKEAYANALKMRRGELDRSTLTPEQRQHMRAASRQLRGQALRDMWPQETQKQKSHAVDVINHKMC